MLVCGGQVGSSLEPQKKYSHPSVSTGHWSQDPHEYHEYYKNLRMFKSFI